MTAFDVVKSGTEKIRYLLSSLRDPEIINTVSRGIDYLEANAADLTVRDDLGRLLRRVPRADERTAVYRLLPGSLCGAKPGCCYVRQ